MASIGSLSSSTSSLVSGSGGLHGYGGLASGLDRDTLIESMTYATRAKIAKQQQKKQTYEWKQDAYRSVSDKLVALSSKYMDYTNPTTNLRSSSLFAKTNIVANGTNSSKVSVTSNGSNSADSLTILGVRQLAKNATATSASAVSEGVLKTGKIDPDAVSEMAGQSLTFTYNGQSATIQISSDSKTLDDVVTELKNGLDKAFGKDRIQVRENDSGELEFETTLPGTKDETTGKFTRDTSSILTLSSGSEGMLGEDGAFNVSAGASNRLNLNEAIGDKSSYDLKINGKDIEGITSESTINDIINKINSSDAGVKVSYLQNSDKFMITSTVGGAAGETKIEGSLASIFGTLNKEEGQDAIVTVQYAGSSEQVNLVRSSNTFTQDGLNITVKGVFGTYEEGSDVHTGKIDVAKNAGNEVTFESKANVDSLLTTIKDMVAAYNEVVDLVNSLVSTKPDRDYSPLTDDQKEEMTDEQIEKWEKKAKEGILFGDDLLRNLSSDLRFVAGGSLMNQLEEIGISEASGYSSNGKLTIDETKLKNALENDPDKVGRLFTDTNNGLMTNMVKVTDSYAKTWGTKGSLIQRAGSESSAMSLTDNEIYKSIKDIDDIISQLQERLKNEQDRYISQFTRLETVIAQMNSQSSYLSSMSGGY